MMFSVYLAASWKRREEIEQYAQELRAMGINVTSHWHTFSHDGLSPVKEANLDLMDIEDASAFILFTTDESAGYQTGGRHVETGYAMSLDKAIYIVGPKENVFHSLIDDISDTWEDFKKNHVLNIHFMQPMAR